MSSLMSEDRTPFKQQAAFRAVEAVESGMVVGLGHGSTAIWAIRRLAELLKSGQLRDVVGVPCSKQVEVDASALGVPLTRLDEHPIVDLTIDGADEVSPSLDLIKGGGGALLREKIVAQASRREIIAVDESKLSPALGTRWAVPLEILPFGCRTETEYVRSLGAKVAVRKVSRGGGAPPFQTDQGNLILDCHFGPIAKPVDLARQLDARAGIIAHGLFVGLATEVIVAGSNGVRQLKREGPS
jgi:ribose 5-phosphate isomerase A